MKKVLLYSLVGLTVIATGCVRQATTPRVACTLEAKICPDGSSVGRTGPNCEFAPCPTTATTTDAKQPTTKLVEPVKNFVSRVTKKPFGILIDKKTSPVQPERFSGYHTGADAEYEDVKTDVPVVAIADGTVEYASTANGYGGVIAIRHTINSQSVLAIYGHLRPSSLTKIGTAVKAGQQIGVLGTGHSTETDGERRHLHLSLFTGPDVVLTGYAERPDELSRWIDPVPLFQ